MPGTETAETTSKDEIKDETVELVEDIMSRASVDRDKDESSTADDKNAETSESTKDVKEPDESTKTKIDTAKYDAAVAAQEKLNSILEDNGYDSMEELQEELDGGKSLRELLGDRDAKDILTKAETLEKYEAHWKEQERRKQQEEEEPEDTIARLKRENQELLSAENERLTRSKKVQEAETAIKTFTSVCDAEMDKAELPKEYRKFVSQFLGVDNPANNVDVSKRTEIKTFAKGQIKSFKDLEQAVIKNYLAGKTKVEKVAAVDTSKAPLEKEPPNKKGLEGLRERFFAGVGIKQS